MRHYLPVPSARRKHSRTSIQIKGKEWLRNLGAFLKDILSPLFGSVRFVAFLFTFPFI